MTELVKPPLPDGIVAVVKRDCPTCELVAPVLIALDGQLKLTVFTQDDTSFPEGVDAVDDTSLGVSWHHGIEAVPTLLRVEGGVEVERTLGWHRGDWEQLTGVSGLGENLRDWQPGCGSLSVDPDRAAELAVRFGGSKLRSRRVELAPLEDAFDAMVQRGWSDGLPLVPPTEKRVMAMLAGTTRSPDEVVAVVPPNLVPCTVEKVAINAVAAGPAKSTGPPSATPASSPSASRKTKRAPPGSPCPSTSARSPASTPSASSPARGRAASWTSSLESPSRSRARSP